MPHANRTGVYQIVCALQATMKQRTTKKIKINTNN